MNNVWPLESPIEIVACDIVNNLYQKAIDGSVKSRNILKKCFEDSWNTIKERFETEGSIWYVWYMDGVRKFILNHLITK